MRTEHAPCPLREPYERGGWRGPYDAYKVRYVITLGDDVDVENVIEFALGEMLSDAATKLLIDIYRSASPATAAARQ